MKRTTSIFALGWALPFLALGVGCSHPSHGPCGRSEPIITQVDVTQGSATISRAAIGVPVTLTPTSFDVDMDGPNPTCSAATGSNAPVFEWTLVSAPTGSTVAAPTAPSSPLTFTPDIAGSYAFSVTVTYPQTKQSSASRVVSVATGDCGPGLTALAISSQIATVGSSLTLSSVPSAIPDVCIAGNPDLTFQWQIASRPGTSSAVLAVGQPGIATFSPDVAGQYEFALSVTDQAGFSSVATATLDAGACSSRPSVAPGAVGFLATSPGGGTSTSIFSAGDTVQLSLGPSSITSGDCGAATSTAYSYQWALVAKPNGSQSVLSAANTPTPVFVPDVAGGSYVVSLVVTDAHGNSSPIELTTLTSSSCGAAPPIVADDVANGVPAFLATEIVPNVQTTSGPQTLTIAHSTLASSPSNSHSALSFYPGIPIQLSANVTDADATCGAPPETLAYSWSIASAPAGSLATFNNPAAARPSFVPDVSGAYGVQVTVTDSTGRSSTSTFSLDGGGNSALSVGACGLQAPAPRIQSLAPIASPSSPMLEPQNADVTIDGSTTVVPDATPLNLGTGVGCGLAPNVSYEWSLLSVPIGSVTSIQNPGEIDPTFNLDRAGDYVIRLEVREGSLVGITTATISAAQSGLLDTTFGNGGSVVFGGQPSFTLFAAAVQPDDKIVATGRNTSQPIVYRFTADGGVDSSFGTGGSFVASTGFQTGAGDGVIVQPDGRIVISAVTGPSSAPQNQFTLFRLTSSGTFDSTFGAGGVVFDDFGAAFGRSNDDNVVSGIALQGDGKIVACGDDDENAGFGSHGGIARFNANGSLDATFGTSGELVDPRTWLFSAVAVDSAGAIVATGSPTGNSPTGYAVGRYLSTGANDASFNGTGMVTGTAGTNSPIFGVAVQLDRKPVAAGVMVNGGQTTMLALRTTAAGALDPSFGSLGIDSITVNPPTVDSGSTVTIRGSSIYVAGPDGGQPATLVIAKLQPNGQLDSAFGASGIAEATLPSQYTNVTVRQIVIQSDGRLVLVGYAQDNAGNDYDVLARFWP